MKKLVFGMVLFGLLALPAARANQQDEEAAIHRRHDEWVAAWNKHDPKLMASFWAADGDLIDPFGKQAKGPLAIEKLFEGEHTGAGVMTGTTYAGTITAVRLLGKNVAIVDVEAAVNGLKSPDGTAAPPFKHHVTWITEKRGGKWMAVAARPCVSVPVPAAPAAK